MLNQAIDIILYLFIAVALCDYVFLILFAIDLSMASTYLVGIACDLNEKVADQFEHNISHAIRVQINKIENHLHV